MHYDNTLRGILVWLLALTMMGCGRESASPQKGDSIAVTNSYIEALVRDLLGDEVPLVPMAGPGMCPGHFDIQPSRIEQLAECRLFLRFDFQQGMTEKLAGRLGDSTRVAAVSVPGGLCEPAAYQAACRQMADILVEAGYLQRKAADQRLAGIERRMMELTAWMNARIDAAKLRGLPVLASSHQEAFCRSLGLNVVAVFSGGDAVSTNAIDEAVAASEKAGVKWIIANLPEGRRMADALADRLGATVIVFGNFPESSETEAFDDLFRRNVEQWTATARP